MICLLGCANPKKPDTAEDAFQPPESVQAIIDEAKAGNPDAQWQLASLYLDGVGVERSFEQVFHWAKKAADQGHSGGMYVVAMHLGYGMEGEKDLVQARHWLRQAATHGNFNGMFRLACMLIEGQGGETNKVEGLKWLRASAELGHPEAQAHLGTAYHDGLYGLDKKPTEGFKWFLRSAEQGDPQGQLLVGNCYLHGMGVEKDLEQMEAWKIKSAEAGNLQAQINLSIMLSKGEFLEKNPARAVRFMEMAARQGHLPAQEELGLHYLNGAGGGKDLVKAYFWFSVAGEHSRVSEKYIAQISVDLEPKVILEQMKKADAFREQLKPKIEIAEDAQLPNDLFNEK